MKEVNIAYQGVQGAFSHQAGIQKFGIGANYLGKSTFPEVFSSLENGESHYKVFKKS